MTIEGKLYGPIDTTTNDIYPACASCQVLGKTFCCHAPVFTIGDPPTQSIPSYPWPYGPDVAPNEPYKGGTVWYCDPTIQLKHLTEVIAALQALHKELHKEMELRFRDVVSELSAMRAESKGAFLALRDHIVCDATAIVRATRVTSKPKRKQSRLKSSHRRRRQQSKPKGKHRIA